MLSHYTPCSYGEFLFGNAQLGDKRRTRRMVELVDQKGRHAGGSLPEKLAFCHSRPLVSEYHGGA